MSLIVFDMGRRVETPVQPERFRVRATEASARVQPVRKDRSYGDGSSTLPEAYRQHEKKPDSIAFAEDIMHTTVHTLSPDDTIQHAWNLLSSSGYHHLPVIDENRHILAIVSDRDLMQALVKQGDIWQNGIIAYASHPVICIRKTTDIRQTSNILYEYNIGALPVINEENELCGIITRSDILKLLSHYGPMELWA